MKNKFNFSRRNPKTKKIENTGFMEFRNVSNNAADLYIYGDIVSSTWEAWCDEDTCPQDISDFMNQIEPGAELTVYINSGGGDVFAGIAIHSILSRHTGHKTGIVDGMAASIASVILMACDSIVMSSGAQIMIHNVEKVATMSGSRVIEVDADSTPWGDVDEGGEFEEEETPNLKQIKYAIKKKGGILKTTRELLQDTAVNILAYLNKWIAKKSRATRNAAILNVINTITKGKEVAVATLDDFKDVFNVKLDPAIAVSSIVLTNQDGFNYMDKLKDKDGKYIMQPDPTDATKTLLFGKYPVKVVSNKTLKSTNVLKGGSGSDKNDVTGYKYPVYMGDLKEAVTLFDREKMTIELSTEAGDLWAKDLTGIKVRDRFDVQSVDETAVVKGEISVAVAG